MGYILLGLYDALAYTGGGTFSGARERKDNLVGTIAEPPKRRTMAAESENTLRESLRTPPRRSSSQDLPSMHSGAFSDSSQNRDIEQLADKEIVRRSNPRCVQTEITPHGGDPRERMGEADETQSGIGGARGSGARARDGVYQLLLAGAQGFQPREGFHAG